jgi:hypothetical protein
MQLNAVRFVLPIVNVVIAEQSDVGCSDCGVRHRPDRGRHSFAILKPWSHAGASFSAAPQCPKVMNRLS